MRTVDLLERLRGYERDKAALLSKKARYMDAATRSSSIVGGADGRGSEISNRPLRYVEQVEKTEKAIAALERRHMRDIEAAMELFSGLPEIMATIMHRFYIAAQSNREIAEQLHYSEGYVRAIRARAVERLQKE